MDHIFNWSDIEMVVRNFQNFRSERVSMWGQSLSLQKEPALTH